ncbi:hypothetical protein [Pseudomonas chlororaphis]|uniref:hypothetical protein n=1 Tax=Pseudomonas chlororaphis TaxID=587753 RepID=UPI00047053C1|nr:hypothetical protein [Pseudomonas chlororaphis]
MALSYSTPAQTQTFIDYDWVVVYLFRLLTANYTVSTLPNVIPFTLDNVRQAAQAALNDGVIKRPIKNIADIKYVYDSRRDFPDELMQASPVTWLSTGKGQYIFRRTLRKNIIDIDSIINPPPQIEHVIDQSPPFTSNLMGTDEQAVFTRVRYAGLINQVLGFQAHPVQGHHRTSVGYGQVEVDEVQAGLHGQTGVIVPISGKGGQDKMSWSQVLNLNTYGEQCLARYGSITPPMTGVAVRSLCLWLDKRTNEIWIVEFTAHQDIDLIGIVQVRRFKFV